VLSVSTDGMPFYDKVFRITHYDLTSRTEFVRITTTTGETLELSAEHMLHAGTCCSLSSLVTADKVVAGDVVFVSKPSTTAVPTTVKSVEQIVRNGRFNAHTTGGHVVVNGIVASHFTTETRWGPDSIDYAPMWYKMVDLAGHIFGAEDAKSDAPKHVRRE